MKNGLVKKMIAVLTATVTLSAMLTGCGDSGDNSGNNSSVNSSDNSSNDASNSDSDEQDVSGGAPEQSDSDVAWDTSKEDEIIVSVINGYYTAGEKKLAEEYMALHPETKVTIDVISDNDAYVLKMQTSVVSGTDESMSPDIVHANFLRNVTGDANLFDGGYMLDLLPVLDMDHPYQDGKVRDMYEESLLTEALSDSKGVHLDALPFDKCGVSFYYNIDMFEEYNVKVPDTWEELLDACKTFRDNGIQTPVTASNEATWIYASLADAALRDNEYDYLIQPGDGIYSEETMSANKDFVFDENNLACDAYTVLSEERMKGAEKNGSIKSDLSKTVWSEYQKFGQYMSENFIAGGASSVTEFEMQISPMMVNGSWNVGLIIDDLNQMPEDQRFEWATFNIPSFANPPEGIAKDMRGLYVRGNVMGIVPKSDEDHNARVLDFYLYWYSEQGAKTCYEATLSSGNYVQGPCTIKGVELDPALSEKLEGFVVAGSVRDHFGEIFGQNQTTEADRAQYNNLINGLMAGDIDIDTFVNGLDAIAQVYIDDLAAKNGYDFDPLTADEVPEQ